MINTKMRNYNYSVLGGVDEYGQSQAVSEEGTIKMAITLSSETLQDNALYSGAQYVGLTLEKHINSKFIIEYGDEKLKVLYVNPQGRYKQVFLSRM